MLNRYPNTIEKVAVAWSDGNDGSALGAIKRCVIPASYGLMRWTKSRIAWLSASPSRNDRPQAATTCLSERRPLPSHHCAATARTRNGTPAYVTAIIRRSRSWPLPDKALIQFVASASKVSIDSRCEYATLQTPWTSRDRWRVNVDTHSAVRHPADEVQDRAGPTAPPFGAIQKPDRSCVSDTGLTFYRYVLTMFQLAVHQSTGSIFDIVDQIYPTASAPRSAESPSLTPQPRVNFPYMGSFLRFKK